MTADLRCLKCGEDRLLDVAKSPSGQIAHVVCQVCSHVSLIAEHQVIRCHECGGLDSHEDVCPTLQNRWAV